MSKERGKKQRIKEEKKFKTCINHHKMASTLSRNGLAFFQPIVTLCYIEKTGYGNNFFF